MVFLQTPPSGLSSLPILKLHDSLEAIVRERLQHRAAGLLGEAGHPVVVTAVRAAGLDVNPVYRVNGWVLIKVVVGPQQDAATVAHGNSVGNVLGVGDVEEASGDPGN